MSALRRSEELGGKRLVVGQGNLAVSHLGQVPALGGEADRGVVGTGRSVAGVEGDVDRGCRSPGRDVVAPEVLVGLDLSEDERVQLIVNPVRKRARRSRDIEPCGGVPAPAATD